MSETSGIESVDSVVASLESLDELPVSEHVAVFERAHQSLHESLGQLRAGPQG